MELVVISLPTSIIQVLIIVFVILGIISTFYSISNERRKRRIFKDFEENPEIIEAFLKGGEQ